MDAMRAARVKEVRNTPPIGVGGVQAGGMFLTPECRRPDLITSRRVGHQRPGHCLEPTQRSGDHEIGSA